MRSAGVRGESQHLVGARKGGVAACHCRESSASKALLARKLNGENAFGGISAERKQDECCLGTLRSLTPATCVEATATLTLPDHATHMPGLPGTTEHRLRLAGRLGGGHGGPRTVRGVGTPGLEPWSPTLNGMRRELT